MAIKLKTLTKTYTDSSKPAVNGISLNIESGQIVTLLGPSGCGKTTTLRLIAGFERPDSGQITLDGKTVVDDYTWTPPEQRGIGMVFQDYALFPHLTIEKNVGFGLKRNSENQKKILDALDMVGLLGYKTKLPNQLSGGQQQRVALARALVRNPVVVLLDEPFSNLDTDLRIQMRHEVVSILRAAGTTAIFVTHDQKEALAISDQIVVMKDGQIQQQGTPREIYQFPDTAFVACFVGQSNLIKGVMGEDSKFIKTQFGNVPCNHTHGAKPGDPVTISVRPDSFEMHPDGELEGEIMQTTYTGESIDAIVGIKANGVKYQVMVHIHPEEEHVQVGQTKKFKVLPHFVAVVSEKNN